MAEMRGSSRHFGSRRQPWWGASRPGEAAVRGGKLLSSSELTELREAATDGEVEPYAMALAVGFNTTP